MAKRDTESGSFIKSGLEVHGPQSDKHYPFIRKVRHTSHNSHFSVLFATCLTLV